MAEPLTSPPATAPDGAVVASETPVSDTAVAKVLASEALASEAPVLENSPARYIGRFAPSPTGLLHEGSLLAAVASYLDARHHNGTWLLRMEDIDPLREVPGAAESILRQLEAFALHWDGAVLYQSQRLPAYDAAAQQLLAAGHAFWCTCSRQQLAQHAAYPGTCRQRHAWPDRPAALRLRVNEHTIVSPDRLYDSQCWHPAQEGGDFVIRRKEGFFAYQLAVVVDDAFQRITDVVRGSDLLDSTPRQQILQQYLQLPRPRYMHLPLVLDDNGEKLAKSRLSPAIEPEQASTLLFNTLQRLGQNPDSALQQATAAEILSWGVAHWCGAKIPVK